MNILIIINDPPYGTEKAYNALRLANQIGKDHENARVRIFLMADAAFCAINNQTTPNGYYNIERMLTLCVSKGAEVKICGSCAEARGISNLAFVKGANLSNMEELAAWVISIYKVIVF